MIRDLTLGVRLAVGGGRVSGQALLRLAMTTLGVALVVAVLLPAAAVTNLVGERDVRVAEHMPVTEPRQGVDPLYSLTWSIASDTEYVHAVVVAPGGPAAPVPPGLDRIPAPGEMIVSPAAREFLAAPEGAAARARLDGEIVGEIGKPGLALASDRLIYLGAPMERLRDDQATSQVYGFGVPNGSHSSSLAAIGFVAPIAVVFLLPLLVFVTTASRMGAAQRDRRLAALRLLGLSGHQVRRVAAAESLCGALTGLVAGGALFLALRPLISRIDLFGLRFFAEDFVPPVPLVVAIVFLVPTLAVTAAIFGLRHTIVEPLGVVRQGKPLRRRTVWRWTFAVIGVALLALTFFFEEKQNADLVGLMLAAGSALSLISVAALLPWAVEKLVFALRGGSPAWQLAVRRLQLDGGTSSRVVSGIVVILAGAILVQTLILALATAEPEHDRWRPDSPVAAEVLGDRDTVDEAERLLAGSSASLTTHRTIRAWLRAEADRGWNATIGSCSALAAYAELGSCSDGDVFVVTDADVDATIDTESASGAQPLQFVVDDEGEQRTGPGWSLPRDAQHLTADRAAPDVFDSVLITPGALRSVTVPDGEHQLAVTGDGSDRELYRATALALRPLGWEVLLTPGSLDRYDSARNDEMAQLMRTVLLTASLFVLTVAALSLVMLSVEQTVERRRPLAAMSAAGVPFSVLARGALWQNTIPMAVGIGLAVAAGFTITVPTLRFAGLDFTVDIGLVGVVCGAAVIAVSLATALTLPLLRQTTRLDGLRAE